MRKDEITEKVYNFKTKYPQGFVKQEIEELLSDYPKINKEKFDDALIGITCMMTNGELIIYHCDIDKALRCGIEDRDLKLYEWD
jgi:hypothetical protein